MAEARIVNRIGLVVVVAVLRQRLLDRSTSTAAATPGDGEVDGRAGDKAIVDPAGPAGPIASEGVDGRPGRARHPGRGGQAGASWSTPIPRRGPAARGSMTRSTSWRRRNAGGRRPRRARSRNCSSRTAAAGSPPMSARPTGAGSIITPISALCAGAPRRAAAAARHADRLCRPHRQRQSRRPAPPFRDQPDGAGREMVAGHADQSLSAACRKAARR